MSELKIDNQAVIEAYNNGESLNSIARAFGTYATSVKRILEKNGVELRHDAFKEGSLYVKDGEKLIEWAKTQGRLVTKSELAAIAGTKRLSPSYFIKYPELGQYVKTYEQKDLQEYSEKLYDWLKENNIQYKPNDRTKLKSSVTALLLGEYSNLAIQINIKPKTVSTKKYEADVKTKLHRAVAAGMFIIWLQKDHFEDLDSIKGLLDAFKK